MSGHQHFFVSCVLGTGGNISFTVQHTALQMPSPGPPALPSVAGSALAGRASGLLRALLQGTALSFRHKER